MLVKQPPKIESMILSCSNSVLREEILSSGSMGEFCDEVTTKSEKKSEEKMKSFGVAIRAWEVRSSVVKLASQLAELAEFAFSAMEIELTRSQNRPLHRIVQTRVWLGQNRLTRRSKTESTESKILEGEDRYKKY